MNRNVWDEMSSVFVASIRSVGTACTLAAVGVYLHRRQFIVGDAKRTLALISQQVTIPLLFFTKILYCNQDWSPDPCPDVTQSLKYVWSLSLWPLYVVGVGFLVGYGAARLSGAPRRQWEAILVACAFGNSTGLPITLLTVVHTNFGSDTDLGRLDPTLFLSIYLLLYPVLQWGVGGWLLAPPDDDDNDHDGQEGVLEGDDPEQNHQSTSHYYYSNNVVSLETSDSYNQLHRGMAETDASMYMSVPDNLYRLGRRTNSQGSINSRTSTTGRGDSKSPSTILEQPDDQEETPLLILSDPMDITSGISSTGEPTSIADGNNNNHHPKHHPTTHGTFYIEPQHQQYSTETMRRSAPSNNNSSTKKKSNDGRSTLANILNRCLQPPVVGALLGMIVASQSWLRGIFVDVVDRQGHAPLQFLFDGLYTVGQAAVPINMMILGCNLSASYSASSKNTAAGRKVRDKVVLFSRSTTIAISVAKLIVMPIIGILSTALVKHYYWNSRIPDEIDGGVYLVAMLVFLTPTANNVMVMVELGSGGKGSESSGLKQAMARIIAWQYALAPIVLSITMTVAVSIAVRWS